MSTTFAVVAEETLFDSHPSRPLEVNRMTLTAESMGHVTLLRTAAVCSPGFRLIVHKLRRQNNSFICGGATSGKAKEELHIGQQAIEFPDLPPCIPMTCHITACDEAWRDRGICPRQIQSIADALPKRRSDTYTL